MWSRFGRVFQPSPFISELTIQIIVISHENFYAFKSQ